MQTSNKQRVPQGSRWTVVKAAAHAKVGGGGKHGDSVGHRLPES